MNKFDEIMRLSNSGYIDNPRDVEAITDSLMSSPITELASPGNGALWLGETLCNFYYLPKGFPELISFGDVLNMVRVICLKTESPQYAARLVMVMKSMISTVGRVRLFMAIPIKSFTDYIAERSGSVYSKKMYGRVCNKSDRYLGFTIRSTTTFEQFFDFFTDKMRIWKPEIELDRFVEYTMACCEIVSMLLINCMYVGYPEMFRFGEFANRLFDRSLEKCENNPRARRSVVWLKHDFERAYGSKYDDRNTIFDSDKYFSVGDETLSEFTAAIHGDAAPRGSKASR